MNRFLFNLFSYTDGVWFRTFWNACDWLAALVVGYGLGTGSAWLYHCGGYLAGRACGVWLRRKNDRDLAALAAQWREFKRLTEEGER